MNIGVLRTSIKPNKLVYFRKKKKLESKAETKSLISKCCCFTITKVMSNLPFSPKNCLQSSIFKFTS